MKIFVGVTDHLGSEVNAMVQAMYSRSDMSIMDRLQTIEGNEEKELEIKNNLKKFYLGYGHKSIGQLGYTTVFIENVSILAAKIIENTPLYDGQEVSTRYLDFSDRPTYYPNIEIKEWQDRFITLYNSVLPRVIEQIKLEYPYEDNSDIKENVYLNTIKARAFDITRGLLPAGMTTSLSFMGSFDLINDHFGQMLFHPLQELRDIATAVLIKAREQYPHAIKSIEELSNLNKYLDGTSNHFYYEMSLDNSNSNINILINDLPLNESNVNQLEQVFSKRGSYKQELPKFISGNTIIENTSTLDYGSYRDIHRHRNGRISFPILDTKYGINQFYLDMLNDECLDEVLALVIEYTEWYKHSNLSKTDKQYSTPIGFNVRFKYKCDLNQFLYILELRSQKTVHQSLRLLMHCWETNFLDLFKEFKVDLSNNMFTDRNQENFSFKRGTQTFSQIV